MSDDKKPSSSASNTRWWESYLARYFSGAIVGAICLSAILMYADWRLYKGAHIQLSLLGKGLSTAIVLALIASGLVYSYVISAPITVIHFGRSGKSPLEQHVRYFWFGWVIALFAMQFFANKGVLLNLSCAWIWWWAILLICSLYLFNPQFLNNNREQRAKSARRVQRQIESSRNVWRSLAWAGLFVLLILAVEYIFNLYSQPIAIYLLAFALPTIFVGIMQYVTLWRIFATERTIHRFYRSLSKARNMHDSKDIRETYTHLREHSNATFIVLLELSFSVFLIFLIEIYAGPSGVVKVHGGGIGSERMVGFVSFLIAFWVTPNLFMWSRANQIERDFARRPRFYLPNSTPVTQKAKSPDEPTEAVEPTRNPQSA
jgi:hypothetical protein